MTVGEIDISVITPSLNMASYLERCVASVADQEGMRAEHLVMDGGSRDGTAEWLAARPWLVSEVRRDNGMYEAVNRGYNLARGRIVAHLNCDEQYLPGALATVVRYFDTHPSVDVLCGDCLVVRPDGSLIACRKSFRAMWPLIMLPNFTIGTSSTFLRRKLIDEGMLYDDSYKDVADLVWATRVVNRGYRMAHVRQFFSVFTVTGSNRSQIVPTIGAEIERYLASVPWWLRRFRRQWQLVGWAQKLLYGCYSQATPLEYAIYTPGPSRDRKYFIERKPSLFFRWPSEGVATK